MLSEGFRSGAPVYNLRSVLTEFEDLAVKMPGKTRKWGIWALELLLLVAIVVAIDAWRSRGAVSGLAPGLNAPLVEGGEFDLSRIDRPIVVHFWATWCPVCRLGRGSIDELALEGRAITVALSSGSDREIIHHLREAEVSFPVVNDESGLISHQWGVNGVPASFIIDSAGQIRFVTFGHTTELGLRARLWLSELDA